MRKIFLFFMILISFVSCSSEILNDNLSGSVNKTALSIENDTIKSHELLEDFSKALSSALNSSVELRRLIKNEALKMFDYDYDVLYLSINTYKLSSGKTVDELMELYIDTSKLELVKQKYPTLTIFVPVLPDNSFSAESWNPEDEIPYTALRVENSNDIMAYGIEKEFLIPSNEIPKYPILVIKLNERIISVNKVQKKKYLSACNTIDDTDIVFLSDVFDNTKNESINRSISSMHSNERDRTGSIPDNMKKVYEAYDIYNPSNGWLRDYIYFDLTPQKTKGAFNLDFKESLVHFKLIGDPRTVMNKICDQTNDPRIDGNSHEHEVDYGDSHYGRPGTTIVTPWTDGFLEFKVKVYVANQLGISNELTTFFTVEPSALFKTTPKDPLSKKYEVKSIDLTDGINLQLPLFEWNIENYGTAMKISIEEIDATETVQSTESSTVTFATNFGFDPSFGEKVKIGLKFGATNTISKNISYTVTKTLGNDELGEVIVNFADKILKSKNNVSTSRNWKPDYTDKYKTGWYQLAVSPLKYN